METVATLNGYLAIFGIALFVGAGILLYDLKTSRSLAPLIRTWGLLGALAVTAGGTITSLIYSEVFGFIPCGLCWLQRIALYPQVLLLAIALYYGDKAIGRYGIGLSIFGIVIGLYQHYLQMGGSEFAKCPTAGPDANCAERILFEFGFVTFPLLSVFTFVFLIALYYYLLRTKTNSIPI